MEYIEMTIEEALEYNKGNKAQVVLVAVKDLEKNEGITEFIRKSKKECEDIIRNAETIAKLHDKFISQLRVFTRKQIDLKNIKPYGRESTILYHTSN